MTSVHTLPYCHINSLAPGKFGNNLTHWGQATHICVSEIIIIVSDNGLSPGRCQAIIWTNVGILLIGPLGINFSEILIEINTFSFKKMHLKMSSAKWHLFCFSLNVLKKIMNACCDIALWWMPQNTFDDESTLVQVMAWCHQTISYYLRQCWLRYMSTYDIVGSQWVKSLARGRCGCTVKWEGCNHNLAICVLCFPAKWTSYECYRNILVISQYWCR